MIPCQDYLLAEQFLHAQFRAKWINLEIDMDAYPMCMLPFALKDLRFRFPELEFEMKVKQGTAYLECYRPFDGIRVGYL